MANGAKLSFGCFHHVSLVGGVIVAPNDALVFLESCLCVSIIYNSYVLYHGTSTDRVLTQGSHT
jgi:hypothetical protein